jgi:acylphosphatase
MRVARRFVVSGRVQGVGFRYFTQETAQREGATGWVRNLPDGRVELQVTGDENELRAFLDQVAQSELHSLIRQQTENKLNEPVAARGFEIRHD